MKRSKPIILESLLVTILFSILGCSDIQDLATNPANLDLITVKKISTNAGVYQTNDEVKLSFELFNSSDDKVELESVKIVIQDLEDSPNAIPVTTSELLNDTILEANENIKIDQELIYEVESSSKKSSYGIFLQINGTTKVSIKQYLTFFRVVSDTDNLTFDVKKEEYENLPVFTLKGGLSAEYTVQKALSSLAGGISHSWNVPSPGMGPAPIPSTPDFLERSVKKTVDIYNQEFGVSAEFETVIISTGIPSAAYIGHAMNAPVLPIHFLVGAHTTKEVRTILDYNASKGIRSYATMGHDYSLSNTQSVVWVKLLSLPPTYQKFIEDHKVKQVIFFGALGRGGESGARKVKDNRDKYESGSIYLMHFAGNQSEQYLGETIRDFNTANLEPFDFISDWEAGVVESQVDSIANQIRNETAVSSVSLVTTDDAIHLWNMGTYLMLNLLKVNDLELKGISLNPYLIGHPFFETFTGYVPFLYWQGIDSQYHIDSRLNTTIKGAVKHFYPQAQFDKLTYWVNSTNNFGGANQGEKMSEVLKKNGFKTIIDNNYSVSETWDLSDGTNSSSEIRAKEIMDSIEVADLKSWKQNLKPLSLQDIEDLAGQFPNVKFLIK